MLGALALGDIGLHFPDTDASFKNIDSKILLQKTYNLISEKKYEVVNIDSCVVLESPKILKYAPEMQIAISKILKIEPSDVSIKATTNEKLGYIGRGEGIVAHAVVLLQKK
jgi:2-C-methyl-D-erythritol 2,4-cyclodiphosphate synthase